MEVAVVDGEAGSGLDLASSALILDTVTYCDTVVDFNFSRHVAV